MAHNIIFSLLFLWFFCVIKFQEGFCQDDELILQIEDGLIQGRRAQNIRNNQSYYAFEGIPFAKPPIGSLRFQPPVTNEKWDGILNATKWKHICIQANATNTSSEDCLYINVYTNDILEENLPVMVWIYGGAFTSGSGNIIPDYLLEQQDIILVSFNYRVDIFGFISTGDLVLPGNAGLKDQVLALQWVQKNIAHFGGNPQNVTIFGESAGAASISYLLETNVTTGLFNKAILQSGSSLCLWSLTRISKDIAFSLGQLLDVSTSNSSELLEGLQKIDADKLLELSLIVSAVGFVVTNNPLQGFAIGPVKEPEHDGALFTGLSHQMLSEGNFQKVSILAGHNSQEAIYGYSIPYIIRSYLLRYDVVNADLVPKDMNISNLVERSFVGGVIKGHYVGLLPLGLDFDQTIQFVSDDQFNRPTSEFVRLVKNHVPVYYYVLSYVGPLGALNQRTESGVGHAEDLPYLLYPPQNNATATDILVSRRMCRMWTNFAKYGNPTPEEDALLENVIWPLANTSSSATDLVYLDINLNMTTEVNPNKENLDFYQTLYELYGVPPYDTY